MNKLTFSAQEIDHYNDKSKYNIDIDIIIDNIPISNGYDIDIFYILSYFNGYEPYEHSLWTCDCGVNGCAGIVDMNVIERGDDLFFIIPNEISTSKYHSFPSPYREWLKHVQYKTYHFSRNQIKEALLQLADNLENIINNSELQLSQYNIGQVDYGDGSPPINLPDHIRSDIQSFVIDK